MLLIFHIFSQYNSALETRAVALASGEAASDQEGKSPTALVLRFKKQISDASLDDV